MSFKNEDFVNFIRQAEAAYDKVRSKDKEAIDYIENVQEPRNVPKNKEYVKYNIITYRVRRRIGEILNSKISPILIGAGDMAAPIIELFNDILDENRFHDRKMASAMHYFFPTGRSGFKFIDDPRKESKYGVGSPEIDFLRPDQIRTDPDSKDPFHHDDIFRIHSDRVEIEYAKKRWPQFADQIVEQSESSHSDNQVVKYADLHEIEYRVKEFSQQKTTVVVKNPKTGRAAVDRKGNPVFNVKEVEREVYYITKYINRLVQVLPPQKTGYPIFRIIPLIHTPSVSDARGRNGFGLHELLKQSQDLVNVTNSVMLECVKASIKQMIVAMGVSEDEQEEHKRNAAKTNAYFAARSPSARLQIFPGPPLPASVVEFTERVRFMADEIEASYAPGRGEVSGELSGRAISNLQIAGSVPEITSKNNIKTALTDLSVCIFHYIRTRMKDAFAIDRVVDGVEQRLFFNRSSLEDEELGDLNVFQGGFVNDLTKIPRSARIKVDVDMNHHAKRQDEINTALLLDDRGKISMRDLLETLYPNRWEGRLENIKAENQAQALIQDMLQVDPDAVSHLAELWNNRIKPELLSAKDAIKKVEK